MMMPGFNERLKMETARRDAAIERMNTGAMASGAVVMESIQAGKTYVNESIQCTQAAVSGEIDHVRDSVNDQVNKWISRFDLAEMIRKHPYGATFGAMAIGAVVVPLISSSRKVLSEKVNATVNANSPDPKKFRESLWMPLATMLLENLPAIAAGLLNSHVKPGKQDLSAEPPAI
jgi:hypothetical protein